MEKAILAIAVWVCVMIAWSAVKTTRSPRTRAMYAGLRPRHVGWGAVVLAGAWLVSEGTLQAVPATHWAWWREHDGASDVALGRPPVAIAWIIAAIALMVAGALPGFVWLEERIFRRGTERRGPLGRAGMAAVFGAGHVVLGAPVHAGIAIAAAGFAFSVFYLRAYRGRASRLDAMFESVRVHLAFDLVLVTTVVAGAFWLVMGD
jgi:hypothetical protein